MPVRPSVNHTGLCSDRAVPKPCLSAGVNTASAPGAPGADAAQAARGVAPAALRATASSAETSVRMRGLPEVGFPRHIQPGWGAQRFLVVTELRDETSLDPW